MPQYRTSTDKRCKISELEKQILAQLSEHLPEFEVIPQVKLSRWVFDAAIQNTRTLIEINGNYWHDKPEVVERDAKKQAFCERHGYRLVVIEEGRWNKDPVTELQRALEQIRLPETENPTPEKADIERYRGSGDWMRPFLASLATDGNIRQACKRAGIERSVAYDRYESDSEFAKLWDAAMEDACDELEYIGEQRAREQSDTLLIFFLKARRPNKYRENVKHEHSGELAVVQLTDEERSRRIDAILDRARARRDGSAPDARAEGG